MTIQIRHVPKAEWYPEAVARCEAFEAQYGVPSDRLADAFRDTAGVLHETADFAQWSHYWALLRLGDDRTHDELFGVDHRAP